MSTHFRDPLPRTEPFEIERIEACPVCGAAETTSWRRDCRDWQRPNMPGRFFYERCAACRACFLALRPTETAARHVYFEGYGPYRPGGDPRPEKRRSPLAKAVLGLLRRRLERQLERAYTPEREGETLLDYGCGTPVFLNEARTRGFATIGVDFAEDVVQAVRAQGHEGLVAGEDFTSRVPESSVGCVRMNHVVEHLYRPREVLASIGAKMRPGGRIHVATPNPESVGSMAFRRRWHALDCPRHVVLYEPRVLRRLMDDLGFEVTSVVHEVGPKDLARSWGIVRYENGRAGHEDIEGIASSSIASALMLPVAGVAALLGRADRYHLFARRR